MRPAISAKTDRYRLERIAEIGRQLLEVVARRGITTADIDGDIEIQWPITTPLYNIGEQTNCLSDGLTSAHPDVPWAQVAACVTGWYTTMRAPTGRWCRRSFSGSWNPSSPRSKKYSRR